MTAGPTHLSTGKPRRARTPSRDLDKFYTRPDVAGRCVRIALAAIGPLPGRVLYIEPAAGDGAFLDEMPEPRVGLDIAPAPSRPDILKADFLRWRPEGEADAVVVIGNPPFGKNASLAVRFLNHAGTFADYVAFIVPRTFEKDSTKAKILPGLELLQEEPMQADSFQHEGEARSVPVVFQVWRRSALLRAHAARETKHPDFEFLKTPAGADFAFQRVGARAGKVSVEALGMSPQSHYFIKVRSASLDVRAILAGIDWSGVKHRTAGNPSIGKAELVAEYRLAVR